MKYLINKVMEWAILIALILYIISVIYKAYQFRFELKEDVNYWSVYLIYHCYKEDKTYTRYKHLFKIRKL